jgi:hypothetical protein
MIFYYYEEVLWLDKGKMTALPVGHRVHSVLSSVRKGNSGKYAVTVLVEVSQQ